MEAVKDAVEVSSIIKHDAFSDLNMYSIRGDVILFNYNNDLFKPEKLQVNYTEDKIGKMLSIGDGAIQFSIPFDAILKKIEKGGR